MQNELNNEVTATDRTTEKKNIENDQRAATRWWCYLVLSCALSSRTDFHMHHAMDVHVTI